MKTSVQLIGGLLIIVIAHSSFAQTNTGNRAEIKLINPLEETRGWCVDLFARDPEKSLQETEDVVVCPTCLGEKPLERSIPFEWAGHEMGFCRCPYCLEEFQKDPDRYLARLEGKIPFETVLRHC